MHHLDRSAHAALEAAAAEARARARLDALRVAALHQSRRLIAERRARERRLLITSTAAGCAAWCALWIASLI